MNVHADDPSDGSALRLVHDDLVRIESHWTAQVQNQRTRILAVLTVNGFALAFLASAGFLSSPHGDAFHLLRISVVALTLALIVGVIGLFPRIPIGGRGSRSERRPTEPATTDRDVDARGMFGPDERWLDACWVWEEYRREHGEHGPRWMVEVCRTLASNQRGNRDLRKDMVWRRAFLYCEIALIVAALVVLLLAVVKL
jgi:hypothetical protein